MLLALAGPVVVWSAVRSAAAAAERPMLECAQTVFEFGEVAEDAVVEHEFVLVNRGKGEVSGLAVMPDCGCIAAELSSDKAAAGGQVIAHVRMDVQSYHGAMEKKVYVTAGEGKPVVLVLRGVVR